MTVMVFHTFYVMQEPCNLSMTVLVPLPFIWNAGTLYLLNDMLWSPIPYMECTNLVSVNDCNDPPYLNNECRNLLSINELMVPP